MIKFTCGPQKTRKSLYLSKNTIQFKKVFRYLFSSSALSRAGLKWHLRFFKISILRLVNSASFVKRKSSREKSSLRFLSRPRVLFSLTMVFLPKVGIMNQSKGSGLYSKRSGSSTLIVSYFVSSSMKSIASSKVMLFYCRIAICPLRIFTNCGFCSFKKYIFGNSESLRECTNCEFLTNLPLQYA